MVAGLIVRLTAIATLKQQFTVDVAIVKDHKIIDKGLYGIVRHPSYLGSLLTFMGLGLALQNWLSLLVLMALPGAATFYRISVEEKALIDHFGSEYTNYMSRTRRLIPGLNMKQIIKAFAGVTLAVLVLVMLPSCVSRRPTTGAREDMQNLISGLLDKSVKNCVLSVMKGDGSFSWSGAAGIAHQNGQVPMTEDTPIYIASITKLYTATVIMRLYETGALSLDDPMAKYLPEELIQGIHVYKGRDYSHEVTIKQLLSHTSGIADYYSEKGKDGKSLFDLSLENPDRVWTVDETIERARKNMQANFPPGTKASYSDTNFQLLGKIIEVITGKPIPAVYQEFLFTPLGLKNTWLVGHIEDRPVQLASPADVFYRDSNISKIRSHESYWADGGIVSTSQEMITFLKALNEGKIVRPDTLKLMHNWHKLEFPMEYGYGTMLFKPPSLMTLVTNMRPLWGHSGSTGSFLYYSDELNLYMAGTIDQADSQVKPFELMSRVMKVDLSGS
jgi:D-alanyl-D-alanine carboxypeptidase